MFETNRFAAASLGEVLKVLSRLATKYKREYKRVPVLIIDNADQLLQENPKLLNLFQDYAKDAADKERINIVFVSSERRILRHMLSKSIMFIVVGNAP